MSQNSTDRPRRPPSGKDPGSGQSQRQRFIEAARELGCDDDEDALKARMKRLAETKPTPLKSLPKRRGKKGASPAAVRAAIAAEQRGASVSERSTEDLLSMAQRHVAEGEAHVARQEALIVKLDRDGHTELAVEARALLTTLQTSLRLAYEDLLWIADESRRSGPE